MSNPNLDAALSHAAAGRPVFPCDGELKRPVVKGGFKSASTDVGKIQTWFRDPSRIPGMPVGDKTMGGCWVLDIDVKHGAPGEASFAALIEAFGALPKTVQAITYTGGRHLYFRHPGGGLQVRNRQHRLGQGNETWGRDGYPDVPFELADTGELEIPGIDVRGDGGYVIVPGAVMVDGRSYTWAPGCAPEQVPIAEAPAWLLALVATDPSATAHQGPRAVRDVRQSTGATDGGTGFFAKVNSQAMANLSAWVPTVFPAAKPYHDGFRVTSKALGRALEEDISLVPAGIRDFGEERGKTPIDIVCEWGSSASSSEAALWLCSQMGVDAAALGWRDRQKAPQEMRPTADGGNVVPISSGKVSSGKVSSGKVNADKKPRIIREPAGDWRDQLIVKVKDDGSEQVLCRVHNLMLILAHAPEFAGRIRYNAFTQTSEVDGQEIDDGAMARLKAQLERGRIADKVPTQDVLEAINGLAPLISYHPVRDYLDGVTWDGTERIADFFPDHLGTPKDRYHMGCARAFFVSAVARIYQPGVKVDLMTILEGAQGGGKSTLWEVLGGEWYADITDDINTKDFQSGLHGVWIADLGELDQFGRADSSRIKSIVSIKRDRLRRPYAKFHVNFPRSTILVGGSNRSDWLNDPTGGRRFLPVSCRVASIDTDVIRAARDQLWAEAVHRFRSGDTAWWDVPDAASHQAERFNEDPWQLPIEQWLIGQFGPLTSAEILSACIKIEVGRQTRSDWTRVGNCMMRLTEWERKNVWIPAIKKQKWAYVRRSST